MMIKQGTTKGEMEHCYGTVWRCDRTDDHCDQKGDKNNEQGNYEGTMEHCHFNETVEYCDGNRGSLRLDMGLGLWDRAAMRWVGNTV